MTARNYDADEECCCGASITLRGYYLSTQVQNELAAWRKNHRHEAPEPRSGTGSVKIEPRQRAMADPVSVQESIAAALAQHHSDFFRDGPDSAAFGCPCGWRGQPSDIDTHLAAVAMDATRQAVAEMDVHAQWDAQAFGLVDLVSHRAVLDLLTPEGERDA